MKKNIYEQFNQVKMNLSEYETFVLSPEEKDRLKDQLLREVTKMKYDEKKQNRKKIWKIAGAAAACMALLVAAGSTSANAKSFFSSTFQKMISGNAQRGEKDAKELNEIYTKIGGQSTPVKAGDGAVLESENSGVKIKATDFYCDGFMLYYTLELSTDQADLTVAKIDGITTGKPQKDAGGCKVSIDGEENPFPIHFAKESDGTFTSLQNECLFYGKQPKQFQNGDVIPVEISISSFTGVDYDSHDEDGEYVCSKNIEGEWKLSFPVTVDTSDSVVTKLNKEDNGVKLVSATKSKYTLNLVIEEPDYTKAPYNDKYNDPDICIKDSKGNALQWLGGCDDVRKDGTHLLRIVLLDNGDSNLRLEVTTKNKDQNLIAGIDFKVNR